MNRKAALVFNPTAGQRARERELAGIERVLGDAGWTIERRPTAAPGDATRIARRAVATDVEAVFVLGGDGTVREVAEGVLGTPVAIGVLPGGTTNVVAQALGLPEGDPLAAARLLAHGATRPFDVGLAAGRPFLMQFSAGFDAATMARVRPRAKRGLGKLAIAWAGLATLASYRFPEIAVEIDGVAATATGVVVANLAFYAGPYEIVPGASAFDGKLDVLLFRGRTRRAAIGFALDLARGRHVGRPDVEIARGVTRIVVGVAGRAAVPAQLDGDFHPAPAPIPVELSADRLALLVP